MLEAMAPGVNPIPNWHKSPLETVSSHGKLFHGDEAMADGAF